MMPKVLLTWVFAGTLLVSPTVASDTQHNLQLTPLSPLLPNRVLQDAQACYDALYQADGDNDREIDQNEFVDFLSLLGPPGFLGNADSFDSLPVTLRSNFLILACFCLDEPNADPGCCVEQAAHIDNIGAGPNETPTPDQVDYLDQVCFLTATSIQVVIENPTPAPVRPPTPSPTRGPTQSPTAPDATLAPSASPTTTAPTTSPTLAPVVGPTQGPSSSPSLSPTKAPVEAPTAAPSKSPTLRPTVSPTVATTAPTTTPTLSPTAPTASPTERPSSSPTVTPLPTSDPSAEPTNVPTTSPAPTTEEDAIDAVATVSYLIAVRGDADFAEYEDDLRISMDNLASQVAATLDPTRLLRRRLEVTVAVPTTVGGAFGVGKSTIYKCPS